jgi:hypothetical protein
LISRWLKIAALYIYLKINGIDILTLARQEQIKKGESKNFIFRNGPQKGTEVETLKTFLLQEQNKSYKKIVLVLKD